MSNQPKPRPTVGEIATRVCQAAMDSGIIVTFGQPTRCTTSGRDMIEMRDKRGASHFVFLPAPASATAQGDTFGRFMQNAGIRAERVFGAPSAERSARFARDFVATCEA